MPALHTLQFVAPAGANVLLAHATGGAVATEQANPAGQAAHAVALPSAYEPESHAVHTVAVALEYLPKAQPIGVVVDVALQTTGAGGQKNPAGHGEHIEVPELRRQYSPVVHCAAAKSNATSNKLQAANAHCFFGGETERGMEQMSKNNIDKKYPRSNWGENYTKHGRTIGYTQYGLTACWAPT